MHFRLIALPLPPDMSLVKVTQKAGSKVAPTVARFRSLTSPFTIVDGDEQTVTTAKGNSGHNVPLNAAQYAEALRVLTPLRTVAEKGAKASAAERKAAEAIIAEISANGGIRLPVNRQGRKAAEGESIGSLFAGIVAAEPTEETAS